MLKILHVQMSTALTVIINKQKFTFNYQIYMIPGKDYFIAAICNIIHVGEIYIYFSP